MAKNVDEAVSKPFKPTDNSIVTPEKFQDFLTGVETFEQTRGRNATSFDVENIAKETLGKDITLEPYIDVRKIALEEPVGEKVQARETLTTTEKAAEPKNTEAVRTVIDKAIEQPETIGETIAILEESG